ncbi:MAG: beta-galactosidase [Phycisphaerae bacterium]
MKIGSYYYPEQWPRDQWERDLDALVALGLKQTHFAEFAWNALEPEEGNFDFGWLDEAMDLASARGLDVVMCTPTAAPPSWLSRDHPEILPTRADGSRGRHGGRRHYSPTSPAMLEAAARITQAMADHYADHPSIVGWQIDNELAGDGFAFDQSEHSHAAFRQWLQEKYGDIDALNHRWGNAFWCQQYTDFAEILLPVGRDANYANPHHHLDASRFWSAAWAKFTKVQADILRPVVGGRFITTNFMPFHQDVNPADLHESLSLYSWDSYPATGWGGPHADERYRLADPGGVQFVHDLMRSYTGRWALMEVQPGQLNWSGVPMMPYPGAIRLWLWTAIAHGCEFINVYRLKQPTFGIEMWHDGLLGHDGVTPTPGGEQFRQTAREAALVEEALGKKPASDYEPLAGADAFETPVGILFDFEHIWAYATHQQAKGWNYVNLAVQWHQAAACCGLGTCVLQPGKAIPESVKVLVVPGLQMVDSDTIDILKTFVERGGHLVLTCRTGWQDRDGHFFTGPRAEPILDLIGGRIEAYDALPDGNVGLVTFDGTDHRWSAWAEQITAEAGTEVLARHADQFYKGASAVTTRSHGSGSVTYCGVYDEGTLTRALMRRTAEAAGLPATEMPPHVRQVRRGAVTITLNYGMAAVDVPAPADATFLVGQRRLDPAGVAVWK